MEIHNLREDEVFRAITQICEDEEQAKSFGYLTTPDCRLDAACFVLNRIPARYVTSGRGLAHVSGESDTDTQGHVDIIALSHQGLRRVTTVRRGYYDDDDDDDASDGVEPSQTYFAFPAITGRFLNAETFEPVDQITVTLLQNGEPARMIDHRWQNPYEVARKTRGTFSFRPRPEPAADPVSPDDKPRKHEFCILVEEPHYQPFRHYFELGATCCSSGDSVLVRIGEQQLPDLYLVPR